MSGKQSQKLFDHAKIYTTYTHKTASKKKSIQKTAGATSGLVGNEIADKITKVSKSSMLKSSLCNYSDAYILVKETITSSGRVTNTQQQRQAGGNNKQQYLKIVHLLPIV